MVMLQRCLCSRENSDRSWVWLSYCHYSSTQTQPLRSPRVGSPHLFNLTNFMPLISLCGGPLSGKTAITEKLSEIIRQQYPDREIYLVNYESLKADKTTIYDSMITEKKLNTQLLSTVEQYLTTRRIVIVDMPNLTKSLRYQLHGKANFAGTTSCVVYCDTPYEDAHHRNTQQQIYSETVFEDLWNRLEPPIATCRWDHPLFVHPIPLPTPPEDKGTEQSNDDADLANGGEASRTTLLSTLNEEMLRDIAATMCEQSKKQFSKANLATRSESGAVVNMIDVITSDIISQIIKEQDAHGYGQCLGDDLKPLAITVNIQPYLPTEPTSPSVSTAPTSSPPQPSSNTSEEPPTASTAPATSGLRLVRKTVRGAARSQAALPSPHVSITLLKPVDMARLNDLKLAFTRVVHMMNVKSNFSIAKGFIDFLLPHITRHPRPT